MRLHNTLNRQTVDFKPIMEETTSLYTCGPTVYSHYHVGNLRNAVFNDTLRRALEAEGFKVRHVMNITDVGHLTSDADEGEDKLEKGAKAEGKTVWQVADRYTEAFKQDVASLNIQPPNGYEGSKDNYARATDFIDEQVKLVEILVEKGYAYQTEQAIYFDISKLADYGELTGQKLSDKEIAARAEVVTDSAKRHPQDFAVWFFAAGNFAGHAMKWASPWGEGFPGWHLECSAIIHSTLGDPIDIHTGAVDLIGTHHTNEIAQTEAAYGNKLANYWVHNEYVLVDGQKMSKSLGNVYTLSDVRAKGVSPLALRLLYLQSHYRSQLNFTWESLGAAQNFLNRLYAFADLKFQSQLGHKNDIGQTYQPALNKMRESISNDLNTSEAVAELSALASESEAHGQDTNMIQDVLEKIDLLFGLDLSTRTDITDEQKIAINERETARNAEDWSKADELREELLKQGLDIKDSDRGPVWSRTLGHSI